MNVSQYILNRKPESHRLKTEAERDVPKKKEKKNRHWRNFFCKKKIILGVKQKKK